MDSSPSSVQHGMPATPKSFGGGACLTFVACNSPRHLLKRQPKSFYSPSEPCRGARPDQLHHEKSICLARPKLMTITTKTHINLRKISRDGAKSPKSLLIENFAISRQEAPPRHSLDTSSAIMLQLYKGWRMHSMPIVYWLTTRKLEAAT